MKKFILFIYILIMGIFAYGMININANSFSITLENGASIRTGGTYQGLKFQASASEDFDGNTEHGFFIALGLHQYEEMVNAARGNSAYVGANVLVKKATNGKDKNFAITVYDIPKEEYANTVTVLAYYSINNNYYFSSNCVSRDVIEVARNAYKSGNDDNFIVSIVEDTKVKVIDTNKKVKFYNDLADFTLQNGDNIYLADFTYSNITINRDNVHIYGNNSGVSANGERKDESIINGCIDIDDNVNNVCIDGIKINAEEDIKFNGNSTDVKVINCVLNFNDLGISDSTNNNNQSNLIIKNNLFNASNITYHQSIHLSGYASDLLVISDNKFISSTNTLNVNDFDIKIDKLEDGTYVNIESNEFNSYGANYLIDLCSSMGENGNIIEDNNFHVNIENNKMCEDGKLLYGNGIRITYLSTNANVDIIHNYNFRTSTFYNHILLTTSTTANSTLEQYPNVSIKYNDMSVDPLPGSSGNVIPKPSSRASTPSKAYVRIGLGLPDESDDYHVNLAYNYYADSTSRYAYEDLDSSAYDKNTNQVVLGSNAYNNKNDLENGYSTYLLKYDNFKDAILSALNENIIKDGYENKIAYHNGNIEYIGDFDTKEMMILKEYNVGEIDNLRDYYKEIIKEVAYSFYYQGTQIQYDQYNSRRNVNSNPDDATEYRGIYLDCSSYVNSVYHYVFNTDISNYKTQSTANFEAYAVNGGRSGDIVYYCDTTISRTNDEKNNILNEVKGLLEVGDVINYRHGGSSTGGHVMMYIGNDYFLHCTGSSLTSGTKTDGSFDPSTITSDGATSAERSGGAIQLLKASELFSNTSSKRYLFYTDQTSFCVIRPLNRDLSLTNHASNKAFLMGLTFEKTASAPHMASVNKGEEITYTITIKNNSNKAINNIDVCDYISPYCEYKAGSINNLGEVVGNNVSWSDLSINANGDISLTYTVIVKNDVSIGTIIESKDTLVNNVSMNKIYHIVSEYNDNQLDALVTKAKTYIGNNTYSDDFTLFDDIYYNIFNKHLDANIRTSKAAIEALIDLDNNTKFTNTDLSEMIICDLYGGLAIKDEMVSNNNRIRLIKDSYLDAGDIIVLYNKKTNTYKSYMYLGANEDKIIAIDNGTVSIVYTGANLDTFLIQIFAYSRFAIIRPSLSMWNN